MNPPAVQINSSAPAAAPQRADERGCIARLILVLAELTLLAVLALYGVAGADAVPFHGDESTILYTSHDFYDVVQGQPERLLYSANPEARGPSGATEQQLRLLNGTMARYVYGYAQMNRETLKPSQPINEQWDWGASYSYNVESGHMPSPQVLSRARLISSLFLVGALVFLYGTARYIGGPGVAVIAVLYFALNPAVLLNGRRAMQESFWLCFALLGLFIAVDTCARIRGIPRLGWFRRRRSLSRFLPAQFANYFYLGVALGLALASKHTALFYVVAALGAVIFAPLWAKRRIWLRHVFGVPIMLAGLVGAFLALNPAWWIQPADRFQDVLRLRADLLAGQSAAFGRYPDLSARLNGLFQQGFVVQPQYYEVAAWKDFIGDQIAAYDASPLRGISIGGSPAGALLVIVLAMIGLIACLRVVLTDLRATYAQPANHATATSEGMPQTGPSSTWLSPMGAWVALWMALAGAAAAASTPLEWQRYYLPLYPAVAVFLGVGVMQCVRALSSWRSTSLVRYSPTDTPV